MIYIIVTYLLISQTLIMHVSTEFHQKLTLPKRSLKKQNKTTSAAITTESRSFDLEIFIFSVAFCLHTTSQDFNFKTPKSIWSLRPQTFHCKVLRNTPIWDFAQLQHRGFDLLTLVFLGKINRNTCKGLYKGTTWSAASKQVQPIIWGNAVPEKKSHTTQRCFLHKF